MSSWEGDRRGRNLHFLLIDDIQQNLAIRIPSGPRNHKNIARYSYIEITFWPVYKKWGLRTYSYWSGILMQSILIQRFYCIQPQQPGHAIGYDKYISVITETSEASTKLLTVTRGKVNSRCAGSVISQDFRNPFTKDECTIYSYPSTSGLYIGANADPIDIDFPQLAPYD